MAGKRILLIVKIPLIKRLEDSVLDRLAHGKVIDLERLRTAAATHERTLERVRACMAGHEVEEWQVHRLQSHEADDKDLVVTVGGDGTVLTANSLDSSLPMITVNSDPVGSVGMYTRCTADSVAGLFAGWLAGSAMIERIPRLQVAIAGGAPKHILNECLFASVNPAAMSRYLLEQPGAHGWQDGQSEAQRSSGVWISTAAGSTAAIHSAGMMAVPAGLPALLFKVREPFQLRHPLRLGEGIQTPPVGLRLTPAMAGLSIFIDGPYFQRPVAPGTPVEFAPSPTPLLLVSHHGQVRA